MALAETPNELLLGPDRSPLGRFYRWLSFASASVLVLSMSLGYLGLVTAPFGALGALISLLAGMRWLDRQPHLRAVPIRDFALLGLAAAGTFAAARVILQVPKLYVVYWAGLGVLLFTSGSLVGSRPRAVALCAMVFFVFFVAAVFSVRSPGLVRAVETGSVGHARLFLWFGADANLRKQHDPLLAIAVGAGDLRTVRLLLDHGADPNGQTSEFMARTPALSSAAATGRVDIVQLLLDRGASLELCNNWGETALGRAARAGQASTVGLLLSRGANPNHTDRYGARPIDSAREAHHSEVERLLSP